MKRAILVRPWGLLLVLGFVGALCVSSAAQAQCFASGDFDGDGMFTVADYVATIRYINGEGPAPVNLYAIDLNGDCMIDALDVDFMLCYFNTGAPCFPQFPVPTCCNPDTIRGACCSEIDSCLVLNPQNCGSGFYQGDNVQCAANNMCPVVCGDVNGDGIVNISDVVYLVTCIFVCAPGDWMIVGDADCSGNLDISDVVYMISYIFGGGPVPCATCN